MHRPFHRWSGAWPVIDETSISCSSQQSIMITFIGWWSNDLRSPFLLVKYGRIMLFFKNMFFVGFVSFTHVVCGVCARACVDSSDIFAASIPIFLLQSMTIIILPGENHVKSPFVLLKSIFFAGEITICCAGCDDLVGRRRA